MKYYFCNAPTNISVDIVTFWGFWFCEKLKDMHRPTIQIQIFICIMLLL